MRKVKVLQIDQFTLATINLTDYRLNDFSPKNRNKTFRRLYGRITKSELSSKQISVLEVDETDKPRIGFVWYAEDEETGKLKLWKQHYDCGD
jgi:hypothetical protein